MCFKTQLYGKKCEKVQVRVRVRSGKIEVRCASACETIIEVRKCVRHTVKFLATQRLGALFWKNLLPVDSAP